MCMHVGTIPGSLQATLCAVPSPGSSVLHPAPVCLPFPSLSPNSPIPKMLSPSYVCPESLGQDLCFAWTAIPQAGGRQRKDFWRKWSIPSLPRNHIAKSNEELCGQVSYTPLYKRGGSESLCWWMNDHMCQELRQCTLGTRGWSRQQMNIVRSHSLGVPQSSP